MRGPVPPPVVQPTDEQRAAAMAKQQRRMAEHAVLQQRFAEVDVARCIAEAERDQLIQVNQQLQHQITVMQSELDDLNNPTKPVAEDTQPDEGDGKEG
jgi:hypothetical protein